MGHTDIDRLKADASGNTALSERLAEEVKVFETSQDALDFLASRGFDVTEDELRRAAAQEQDGACAQEDGYGALLRYFRPH